MGKHRGSRRSFSWRNEYGGVPAWGIVAGLVAIVALVSVPLIAAQTAPAAEPYVRPTDSDIFDYSTDAPVSREGYTAQTPEATARLVEAQSWIEASPDATVYVGLGDSTRDGIDGPSPFYYDELRSTLGLPAENVVSMGRNGASLQYLLDQPGWGDEIAAAYGDRHAILDLSALTNDVRQGKLGTTADEISAGGQALLQESVDLFRTLPGNPVIKLTVPAPYLAEGEWISGVDPQAANEGVRAAFLAVAAANPDVLIQDAQAELFGTTTDRPWDGDQLHPGADAQKRLARQVAGFLTTPAS